MPCPRFDLESLYVLPIGLAPCTALLAVCAIFLWPASGPPLLRKRVLLSLVVCVAIFVPAFLIGPIVQHLVDRTDEARSGAYAILDKLPQIANVEQKDVRDFTWLHDKG